MLNQHPRSFIMILLACTVVVACLLSGTTCDTRMIVFVCSVALLCLLPGSRSAPLTCDELVRPLVGMAPGHAEGSWAVLAASMTNMADEVLLRQRDRNVVSIEAMGMGMVGTFYSTPCPDCLVFTFKVEGLDSTDLYLVSKRRELEQSEKENFAAQAKCLGLREPVWMDPTKALCEKKPAAEVTVYGPDFMLPE
uniref:Apolipoprotein M n=1 Tax=Hippocampus comes TaxID=109280 RepID=A0A3Q2Z434_HIPCM